MATDVISADLKVGRRRLQLGRRLDTLPERLVLARQQKLPHQDFFLLVLSDEVSRRCLELVEIEENPGGRGYLIAVALLARAAAVGHAVEHSKLSEPV